MIASILGRVAMLVVLVLGVATAVFAVFTAAPGDPATLLLGPGVSPEAAARIREAYCLDCPFGERYLGWLGSIVRGDFGWSFTHSRPVADVLLATLPGTLVLAGASLLLAFTLGTAVGVFQAVRYRALGDRVLGVLSLVLYSVPSFWLAVMLVIVFSYGARNVWDWPFWFPASGARGLDHDLLGPWDRLADSARHMVLPVTALTLVIGAGVARYVRASMVEILSRDYVRSARAKGLPERTVVLRHGLRNGLIPIITLLGLHLPLLLSGAVFVEVVFAWP